MVIEVENQGVLNILNKLPQEDLIIFGKLGYRYIDKLIDKLGSYNNKLKNDKVSE